jgi:hypothetical protein
MTEHNITEHSDVVLLCSVILVVARKSVPGEYFISVASP